MSRFNFSLLVLLSLVTVCSSCHSGAQQQNVTYIRGASRDSQTSEKSKDSGHKRTDTLKYTRISVRENGKVAISEGGQGGSMDDYFEFDHTTLQEALERVGRWYNVECRKDYPDVVLNGKLSGKLTCQQMLLAIGNMCGKKIWLDGGMIEAE